MSMYVESKDFQNKMAEEFKDKDVKVYMKKMNEVKSQNDLTIAFLEMFRENYFGEDNTKAEMLAYEMHRQHRTHQQSIVKNLYLTLKKYAEIGENWKDLRNEAAVKWAKEATSIPDIYFPHI